MLLQIFSYYNYHSYNGYYGLIDKLILIPKLRSHEFPARIFAIYSVFLSDRKAVVQVGESVSEPFDQEVGFV
jgi:hypothetical protein